MFATALLLAAVGLASAGVPFLSDKYIESINSIPGSWRAGRNMHEETPLEHLRTLAGAWQVSDPAPRRLPIRRHAPRLIAELPETFDARLQWPHCPSIKEIRDQGSCSGWAVCVASAIADRVCIATNGTKLFRPSGQDLLSCNYDVGTCRRARVMGTAWSYWQQQGLVSGGAYGSAAGCYPYEVPPCDRVNGSRVPCTAPVPTPDCKSECRAGYNKSFDQDKVYGGTVYLIYDEDDIRAEIYQHGPVVSTMSVYDDFYSYKSGIYTHKKGYWEGKQAVKILGWGRENRTRYWLVANSWNSDWGDQGFFKIKRGGKNGGIEAEITAGEYIPK